jgi:hypothetical protein
MGAKEGVVMVEGHAAMATLTLKAAESEQVQKTAADVLLLAGAYVGASITVLGLIWWLVWPRIRKGIEDVVKQVNETHKSVTVNGGRNSPPTLLDKIHLQGQQLEALAHLTKTNDERTKDLGDKVDLLSELTQETKDQLKAHEDAGRTYLGQVEVVLRGKGIELPPADKGDI